MLYFPVLQTPIKATEPTSYVALSQEEFREFLIAKVIESPIPASTKPLIQVFINTEQTDDGSQLEIPSKELIQSLNLPIIVLKKAAPKPVIKPKLRLIIVKWLWPVSGTITRYFSRNHPALDIAGACGSAIRAAQTGIVLFAGWRSNGGGYQVWLDNGAYGSAYYHMSREVTSRGQHVSRGGIVGYRGSTGYSTGCHLHFEIWRGNNKFNRINPLRFY